MKRYVADTHALHWYFMASPRLGSLARKTLDEGAAGTAIIYVSAITLAELFYLNQKAKSLSTFHAEMARLKASRQFVLVPFTPDDTHDLESDAAVPEMHDRMIAGLARRIGAVCLTQDPEIIAARIVPTLW